MFSADGQFPLRQRRANLNRMDMKNMVLDVFYMTNNGECESWHADIVVNQLLGGLRPKGGSRSFTEVVIKLYGSNVTIHFQEHVWASW